MAFLKRSRGLSEKKAGIFLRKVTNQLCWKALKNGGKLQNPFPFEFVLALVSIFSKNFYVLLLLCLFILLWPLTTTIWQFS